MHLCRKLRWKSYYGTEHLAEADLAELLDRSEVPFSCLHTARPWGPDDQPATPDLCSPERGCYQRSPRLEPVRLAKK